MADDDKTPENDIKEAVPTEPKETSPAPEVVAPAVPESPKEDVTDLVKSLAEKVDELSATVATVIGTAPDTAPVRKPWTHWGSR